MIEYTENDGDEHVVVSTDRAETEHESVEQTISNDVGGVEGRIREWREHGNEETDTF